MKNLSKQCKLAIQVIKREGGVIRTSIAIKLGIHPRTLYRLRELGKIESLSRGVYRISELDSNPDLLVVAMRVPNSVLCLTSALYYHDLTTQIPHEISMAILKGNKAPVIDHPPIKVFKYSDSSFKTGIEIHKINGHELKVYNVEKTIADCFKFRNKIGMDIVLEAFKLYKEKKGFNHKKLLEYAKVCRVDKIMRPYLEASL